MAVKEVAFTMYPVTDVKPRAFQGDVVSGPRCRTAVCLDSEGNPLLLHQLDQPK